MPPLHFTVKANHHPSVLLALILVILLVTVTPVIASEAHRSVDVIIGFTHQVGESEQTIIRNAGGRVNLCFDLINACSATIPEQSIDRLKAEPVVTYIEPDSSIHVSETLPWGVDRVDADIVWGGIDGAISVMPGGNAGESIKVAILDSGIDYNHPDLAANYRGGYDFVNNDTDPMDDHGHGTHCAGIVAAVDNDIGVIGVAPMVELYAVKILDSSGEGNLSQAISGINWAVANGMNIISMSMGSNDHSEAAQNACNAAYDAGLLLVAAAGNDGNPTGIGDNVDYPAIYDSVIAVAATNISNERAIWGSGASSTGPAVELAAPGDSIYSTWLNGAYLEKSGTSTACPHVAGVAALFWAANPGWSNNDVRAALQNTATDLGSPGRDGWYGFGLVNAAAMASTFTVTFDIIPDVASLSIDGTSYAAEDLPASFAWVTGSAHTCEALSPVRSESQDTQYVFTSWSDGVTTPSRKISSAGSYTANYKTQYYLTVDSDRSNPSGESWYDAGTTAYTGIAEHTVTSGQTRYLFLNWTVDGLHQEGNPISIMMNAPHTASARYKTQHYLNISSEYEELSGKGWYDEGTITYTATAQDTIYDGSIRYLFLNWTVDGDYQAGNPLAILMDSPHIAVPNYQTQYYLTIISAYGNPTGDGWYNEGSTASISVTTPVGTIVRKVFTSWSGDYAGTDAIATISVHSPMTVTAQWRNDYLFVYVTVGSVICAGILITLLVTSGRGRRVSRHRAHHR